MIECQACGYEAETVAQAVAHQESPAGGRSTIAPCWNEWRVVKS